jgi:hypothetical protein
VAFIHDPEGSVFRSDVILLTGQVDVDTTRRRSGTCYVTKYGNVRDVVTKHKQIDTLYRCRASMRIV